MDNTSNPKLNKKIIILASLFILTIAFTGALSTSITQSIVSGKIINLTNIGIYSDKACKQPITTLNWGAIPQGTSANQTIYIKNLYSTTLQLSMTTLNWNPTNANNSIAVTWNCEGATLRPHQVLPATISINIASNTSVTAFNMDVSIAGISTQ